MVILHKIVAAVLAFLSMCMWLGSYSLKYEDSTLLSLMVLFLISETIYVLWKRVKDTKEIDVREVFNLAPIWKRILALLLDYVLINVICVVFSFFLNMSNPVITEDTFSILDILWIDQKTSSWFILIYFAYFILFEASPLQATPAKKMLKIKVINHEGERLTYTDAFYRQLGKFNELSALIVYLIIDFISMNKRVDKKSFHDIIANSIVIESKCKKID